MRNIALACVFSCSVICAQQLTRVVVASDGSGDFRTVQQAVDAAPPGGSVIRIRPGTYRERIVVEKTHIELQGLGPAPADVVLTGARAVFRRVRFLGFQDTRYADGKGCKSEQGPCEPARQYFADCYIEGNVDFIFGDALAYDGEQSGYVFDRCRIPAEVGAAKVYLGRPRRSHASMVFLPAGWQEWVHDDKPSLPTVFYAEYGSSGAGANAAARDPHSKQLTQAAKKFLAGMHHRSMRNCERLRP